MSILTAIVTAIANLVSGSSGGGSSAEGTAAPSHADLSAALDAKAAQHGERLDWRHSIVDLMNLVGMDSSLDARKALAQELGYPRETIGSAEMNMWLHEKVMSAIRR